MNDPDMAQYSGTPEESAALERESFIRMNARRAALEEAAAECERVEDDFDAQGLHTYAGGASRCRRNLHILIDKLDKEPKP